MQVLQWIINLVTDIEQKIGPWTGWLVMAVVLAAFAKVFNLKIKI